MKGKVAFHDEQTLIDLGGGVTRRVLSYDENLMSVEVAFETGAVGAVHTQCSYVLSGRFSDSAEGEAVELNPGDSIVAPSNLPHARSVWKKAHCWTPSPPCALIS